jgi:hypothetical protein
VRRIVAAFLLPAFVGLSLGVAALVVVLSDGAAAEEYGVPPTLAAAHRALFVEGLLVTLGEGELAAFSLGGFDERPLAADPVRRHIALTAYRALQAKLRSLEPVFASLTPDGPRERVVEVWTVYLRGTVGWLEDQVGYARDPGFVKYSERPLKSERPYLVEVDRLLAREDYERAVVLGRMALEQRALAWRRAESLSSSAMRRPAQTDSGN